MAPKKPMKPMPKGMKMPMEMDSAKEARLEGKAAKQAKRR